jgi:hypothetical protein
VAPRTDPYVKNYFIRLFARVWYACPGRGRADRGPTAKRPVDSGTVSGTWLACRPVPSRDLLPSTDSAVAGWPTLFARFVGTTRSSDSSKFGAQWLACVCPCRCFTHGLAAIGARLGVKVVCYSFLVRLLHPLLHAGLSRRFHGVPGTPNPGTLSPEPLLGIAPHRPR